MESQKGVLPSPDTLPDLVLVMTALSGELPASQVSRLPGSDSYKVYAVKRLKHDKLLRTYYRDGLRGLRLTSAAKKLLLNRQPDRYRPLFSGETSTNAPKYSLTHRLRLHRMAEVLITMHQAGVCSFPWEKPVVFQPVLSTSDIPITSPSYYSSREIKEMGDQAVMIRGSRATGVLLAGGGIFAVYNTGPYEMKWEYRAEERLKALLQTEVCQQRLPNQFMDAELGAIVFGSGMTPLEGLMGPGNTEVRNYFVLEGSYRHFHYLTNDHYGEVILQLLCDPELKAALDEILSEDLSASRPGWPVENDAIDERGVPVLFGYTCDMPRIWRFNTALALHEQIGTIFCFDFQEETLRRICGPWVTLQSIDFEAYERSVSLYPENN